MAQILVLQLTIHHKRDGLILYPAISTYLRIRSYIYLRAVFGQLVDL